MPCMLTLVGFKLLVDSIDQLHVDKLQKARENMLIESKGEVFKMASHELRNPLQALTFSIDHIMENKLDMQTQQDVLEDIRSTTAFLNSLVENVLDYNMIESKKLKLKNGNFSVLDLVEAVVDVYRNSANRKGLLISSYVDLDIPQIVRGDDIRVKQVLSNLCYNAVKFTEKGTVELRAELLKSDPLEIKFSCIDSGIGINESESIHLFKPFSRIVHDETPKGWGLGLSISNEIVHQMKGEISFTSQVGQGSNFWFIIPLEAIETEPLSKKMAINMENNVFLSQKYPENLEKYLSKLGVKTSLIEDGSSLKKTDIVLCDEFIYQNFTNSCHKILVPTHFKVKKLWNDLIGMSPIGSSNEKSSPVENMENRNIQVLLVEDDMLIRKVQTKLLNNVGMSVICAGNGAEALDILENGKFKPTIAIIDNKMPVMSGEELIQRMKSHSNQDLRKIPILMISGTVNDNIKTEMTKISVQVLQKPIRQKELFESIEKILQ